MFAVFLRSDMKKIHWKYYQSLTLLYLKQELPTVDGESLLRLCLNSFVSYAFHLMMTSRYTRF
jgi:hypothetical protein